MNIKYGFTRVSVCSPTVAVGDPDANAANTLRMLQAHAAESDVAVMPELGITAYTCGDLFRQTTLLKGAEQAIAQLARQVKNQLVFVGTPIFVGTELFNCAVALNDGRVIGIVPKQFIPNYNEFYENRWFSMADGDEPRTIDYAGQQGVPFGTDLLFRHDRLIVSAEICEDLWMPIPPSSYAAIAGANLLVNLSASNETVAKHEYRNELIRNQSGRCLAAYAYASAGPSESTTDLVFSGHCVIADNGSTIAESSYVGDGTLNFGERFATADVDYERLAHERQVQTSFGAAYRTISSRSFRTVEFTAAHAVTPLTRKINGLPFVPMDPATLGRRCAGIYDQQVAGLVKRMQSIRDSAGSYPDLNLGLSGGSDSTHALLVCVDSLKALQLPLTKLKVKSMPGFGTTQKTLDISLRLPQALGLAVEVIDIREACLLEWRLRKAKPFGIDVSSINLEALNQALTTIPKEKRHDLDFENTQARYRTKLLMDSGFVVGTGDMSELALGWCTYNGDQMSMYNVNCSIPKTLIKFLIAYVANHRFPAGEVRDLLTAVVGLTVSPELLPPGASGEIEQSTEDTLGPYALHDFYLLNFVRYGFTPDKILWLSGFAHFDKPYDLELRVKTLRTFLRRFFAQQFKRTAVPGGPKVGSVSLSPRGDWRMPDDATAQLWLKNLDEALPGVAL